MFLYQDVDAKLTLTRVATAPVLVAEIAKLTGDKLDVAPTLANEVLMVSVEGARAADVLAKLAIAATAVWQPYENGYRLMPDVAARNVEGSSERARRLLAITDGLKKRREAEAKRAAAMKARANAPKKTGAKAADAEVDGADFYMSDMGDTMLGMGGGVDPFIPMLDLNALANMQAGDRIVFATNPNGAQRPLRGNPAPLVGGMIAKHNQTAKTMGGNNGMENMPEEAKAFMNGPMGERMRRMSKPIVGAPTKVLVVASRGGNALFGMGGDLDVRLEVRAYGADGKVLIEETGSLGTSMMEMAMAMAQPKKAAAPTGKTTPIVYSDDAKAFIADPGADNPFMGNGFGQGMKMSASLREKTFNPDKFDPLALVPGEGLAAMAKARRKPLVACIPDAAYPGLINDAAPKTVEEVEESVKTGTMRLVPDTTFYVVRATEPETARRNRIDRSALTAFMRAVEDHETPNLDELATYASKTVPPAQSDLSMAFIAKFAPNAMGSMSGMVSWDALRLFATLNPTQRTSLTNGAKIPFGNLTPAAQSALRAMLYGAGDNLTVERPGDSSEPDIFSMSMKMMMGGGGLDAREEPTEAAPRGLPASGFLQATVSTDTVIRPLGEHGPVAYTIGMDELAMLKLLSTSGIPQAEEAMKLPDAGRLGTRTMWNLRGYVGPGAYVGSVLNDDRTPKNGAKVSMGNLPADLQARVAQKAEKLKKSPLGAMMSMGAAFGGGKPPVQP